MTASATPTPRALRSCRRGRSAFTLLELLIALSLLVLLATFAWPLMQNQITASAMPESAARTRDTLFLARAEAMREHRRVRIRFAPNEQQPYIEIESDPILHPGEWTPIKASWVSDKPLLDDVQVHTIEAGRPAYLTPISFDESTDEAQEDSEETQEQESTEDFDATMPSATMANEDIELDENRPLILFGPDGSSEWATLKLSRAKLDVELKEEDLQTWVILDGRTGLAYIREQVTEEQLADEDFYIKRENLELPTETSPEELALGVQDPNAAGGSQGGGGSQGIGGFNTGGQPTGGRPGNVVGPGAIGNLPPGIQDQLGGGGGNKNGGGRGGMNGGDRKGGGPGGDRDGGRGPDGRGPDGRGPRNAQGDRADDVGGRKGDEPADGSDDLKDDLEGSTLTDEERDNIDNALNNDNSNSNTNSNTNSNANANSNSNNNINSNTNDNANLNDNENKNENDNQNGNTKG